MWHNDSLLKPCTQHIKYQCLFLVYHPKPPPDVTFLTFFGRFVGRFRQLVDLRASLAHRGRSKTSQTAWTRPRFKPAPWIMLTLSSTGSSTRSSTRSSVGHPVCRRRRGRHVTRTLCARARCLMPCVPVCCTACPRPLCCCAPVLLPCCAAGPRRSL